MSQNQAQNQSQNQSSNQTEIQKATENVDPVNYQKTWINKIT